ncbi:MAG: hypothetical protein C4617_04715 [Candidatus Liberibacter europaeus]|uniref:Uncharacterized protein n=1 Tax=Candidatus Liberibacter europaeus TaxID=744859 RepID=A0A2T4VWL4_9HYPH|nr:hypothetical protein [Candidatus Liberibacter europaeus]PTL86178.1 MAG: hypothetical protein C4617_04715 [Candidatus Liberibacter europaeus]
MVALLPFLAIGFSVLSSITKGILDYKADISQTNANIETERRRQKLAQENAHLADLEALDQASQKRKEQAYLRSKLELQMSARGLSSVTKELWIGQMLTEMEQEQQTILGAGQKKVQRYEDESDWLRGNIDNLVKSKSNLGWRHASSTLGDIASFGLSKRLGG